MTTTLLLSLATLAQSGSPSGHVVVPLSELPSAQIHPAQEQPAVSWIARSSKLSVLPMEQLTEITLELVLDPVQPTWVSLPVLDGRVRLQEHSMPLHQGPDGAWWFTGYLAQSTSLVVSGTLPIGGEVGQISALVVAPAARQEIHFPAQLSGKINGQELSVTQGVVVPQDRMQLSWSPAVEGPRVSRQVVQAQVASAAWLDEGELRVRSQVRWEVRQGELSQLSLRLPSGVRELDVSGVGIARWERVGDRVVIEPRSTVRGAFQVTVDWRQSFDGHKLQIAHPQPLAVGTTTYSLTLAGDSETLLNPTSTGLRAVAVEELQPHARSLGEAPAAAAWIGSGSLSLQALTLSALEGPELVVDLARCTAAQSVGGRTLMTCSLDLRNASRQFLGVSLPPDFELWSARVNGEGVAPIRRQDGTMGVPLERSVETLAGLTAIQVDLTFVGAQGSWDKRGERALQLPAYDAPVARVEWDLRLPPGYKGKVDGGSAKLAGETQTELVYATVAQAKEEEGKKEAARDTWNVALQAYQDNDFDKAQSYVDQTLELDPTNDNAYRLQSNLDVLVADAAVGVQDEAMSRRVKDMARAKVSDSEVKQEEKLKEAERLLNAGLYEQAIASYEEVAEISDELARYESKENRKQAYYASSSASGLSMARERVSSSTEALSLGAEKDRGARDAPEGEPLDLNSWQDADREPSTVEADGLDIGAELTTPDGSYLEVTGSDVVGNGDVGVPGGGGFGAGEMPRNQGVEGDYGSDDSSDYIEYEEAVQLVVLEDRRVQFDMPATEPAPVAYAVDGVTRADRGAVASLARDPASSSAAGPPPGLSGKTGGGALSAMPALSATTLAIPLPDHGQSVVVEQRLLEPGQAPTLIIRYRETK